MCRTLARREFLKRSAAFGAGLWVVGSRAGLYGQPASEQVNVAIIGVGGRGGAHVAAIPEAGGTIVALCDVDDRQAAGAARKHPDAAVYRDFRKLLDERHRDIDAVVISTPDHTHAVAAQASMQLGKHCYCEKPLTHSIHEARVLRETARRQNVATQMGNGGHSSEDLRRAVEIVRSGALGTIREAHTWTNRPIWPQGDVGPIPTPPVPDSLDWDLWIGPAPERPYSPALHPFKWRGFWDYGTGALGDMGCHIIDAAFWALDLKDPTVVEAQGEPRRDETGPSWSIVTYHFPARGDLAPCTLTWYDGGKLPPAELVEGIRLSDNGMILVGEKGTLYAPQSYAGNFVLLPRDRFADFEPPPPTLPRSPGHHADFLAGCKNPSGHQPCSNFEYAVPLTETVLLGNVAFRAGGRIEWDAKAMKVKGNPDADRFLRREYRKGWAL